MGFTFHGFHTRNKKRRKMSTKIDEREERKRLDSILAKHAVDVRDLVSWKKQSEDILLMRLLIPDVARKRREMAETRVDRSQIVRVEANNLENLNRVVADVRKRNLNRERKDVSAKISLYPGGDLLLLKVDAIAIANAPDSRFHQNVVRLGGIRFEAEMRNSVYSERHIPGDVIDTNGHNLLAKRVMHCQLPESKPIAIHTVQGVRITELTPSSNRSTISASTREALCQCYSRSLDIAVKNGSRTVAFPSLGTGMFGLPSFEAAACAVESIRDWFDTHDSSSIDRVVFVIRDGYLHEAYENLMMECFPFSEKNNPLLCQSQAHSSECTKKLLPEIPFHEDDDTTTTASSSSVQDLERRLKMLID